MSIVRYGQPWSLLSQLHQELLGLQHKSPTSSPIVPSEWTPALDFKEDADKFVIVAEIPCVKPEAIEVSMEAGVLTVKGQKDAGEKSGSRYF